MAVATYTSDLADITMWESDAAVTDFGGGGQASSVGADYAIEGTNAVMKPVSGSERGFLHDNVSNFTIGADDHFFAWLQCAVIGLADTRDNRGLVMCIGDDTSNFVKFHIDGSDTLPFGGMNQHAVRFVETTLTNFRTRVGTPSATPSQIGIGSNILVTAKFDNTAIDATRVGTGYDILLGTGADPRANFAGIVADDDVAQEGILKDVKGALQLQGKLRIGSASTACEFEDSNKSISILDTRHSLTDFTEFLLENASSIFILNNVVFKALGTNNKGRIELITSTATLTFTGCSFIDFGDIILGANSSMINCIWIGSDVITANSANLSGSSISGYEVTANTSPLIWDTAVDVDGKLDNMTFAMGSALTHAIELGTTSPLTMTFNGCDFTGYSATQDVNNSIFHIKRTTGTVTINLVGCTSDVLFATSYRTDGATVVIVVNPVTVLVDVTDTDGVAIEGAQVLLEALDGTGDLAYLQASTVTRLSAVLAQVFHNATRVFKLGETVLMKGSDQGEYNGLKTITNIVNANTFQYALVTDPGLASGTPTITAVFIFGQTDVNGEISASRSLSLDQPLVGWARKGTASPYYRQFPLSGAVDKDNGLTINIQMVSDE
jgi:hypothetical protein